jgi:hypothetical protein
MATRKPVDIVEPAEWVERTKTWHKRGDSMKVLDVAYADWFADRKNLLKRRFLQEALEKYCNDKGNGHWDKVDRNTASNGLMKYIYTICKLPDTAVARAQTAINTIDIPGSRYGVLYLLGNIDIQMNKLSIALEGVGAVGGAVGSGFATDTAHLDSAELSERQAWGDTDIGMGPIKLKEKRWGDVNEMSTGVMGVASGIASTTGTRNVGGPQHFRATYQPPRAPGLQRTSRGPKPPPLAPKPTMGGVGLPVTRAALEAMGDHPVVAVTLFPVSAVAVVGSLVVDAMRSLIVKLQELVEGFIEWFKQKIVDDATYPWTLAGSLIKSITMAVVKEVAKAAVPFVSAGKDVLSGLVESFVAIKMKVGAWWERRKIQIIEGHPELLASSIEGVMTKGILKGLWTLLKGAVQVALAATLPGAQSLVSAVATGVEWVIKFCYRLYEQSCLNKFLLEAREALKEERKLTSKVDGQLVLHRTGGLIHDLPKFKAFFQRGCNASPLIAMLTLNSGICGSLMVMMNMFNDVGVVRQETFDAGNDYFTRLKEYGRDYFQSAGFEFTAVANSAEESDVRTHQYINGILSHAVKHHTGPVPPANTLEGVAVRAGAIIAA